MGKKRQWSIGKKNDGQMTDSHILSNKYCIVTYCTDICVYTVVISFYANLYPFKPCLPLILPILYVISQSTLGNWCQMGKLKGKVRGNLQNIYFACNYFKNVYKSCKIL